MSIGDVLIDYEGIPQQSSSMRNIANQINEKLVNAYNDVMKMHEYWYGKRYNELVTKFNNLVPKLNQFLEVIVSEVPYILDSIANNFSSVDIGQNVSAAQRASAQNVQEIPITADVGMRYLQGEVANMESQIISSLHEAKELMQTMERTAGQMILECDGAGDFKSQFNKLTSSFGQTIDNIESQFTNLMAEDRKQIENAEKSNTVS